MQIFLTLVVIAIAAWYSTREHRRQLRNLKAWHSRITSLGQPFLPRRKWQPQERCPLWGRLRAGRLRNNKPFVASRPVGRPRLGLHEIR
jgi:hypothetical protein